MVSSVKADEPIEVPFGMKLASVRRIWGYTLAPRGEYDGMMCGGGDAG